MSPPYTSGPYPFRVVTQLHDHTTQSDGLFSPAQVVANYAGAGYGALMISDHDKVTAQPAGVPIAILGNEATFHSHILSIGCNYLRGAETNGQPVINGILAAGGIPVIAHPHWAGGGPFNGDTTLVELRRLTGYQGIEIYNAICVGHTNPQVFIGVAIDLWDDLLRTQRRDLWGFAHDDFHWIDNKTGYDMGRLIVWPLAQTPAGILDAIRRGDFAADVANFGVTLNPPTITPTSIDVDCPGATRIRFVTELGLAQETPGSQASYPIEGCEYYVRAEVVGAYVEPFDTPIDLVNRWGARSTPSGGNWSATGGKLVQSDTANIEHQILLKRHLTRDWTAEADVILASGVDAQAGLLVNMLNHDNCYYWCLRGPSTSSPNSLTFWFRNGSFTTPLVEVPFTPTTGQPYRLKVAYDERKAIFSCSGWAVGQPEPAPQVVIGHEAIRHGAIGFRCRRNASFDNLTIDGFTTFFQPHPVRP